MIIYDWDDTLQLNLNVKSSIGMMIKTLLYKADNDLIKLIVDDDERCIITTRARLYTWFIMLKCFLITWNFNVFSNVKISTINPYFFFNGISKNRLGTTSYHHLTIIKDLKIKQRKLQDAFRNIPSQNYLYVDNDLVEEVLN